MSCLWNLSVVDVLAIMGIELCLHTNFLSVKFLLVAGEMRDVSLWGSCFGDTLSLISVAFIHVVYRHLWVVLNYVLFRDRNNFQYFAPLAFFSPQHLPPFSFKILLPSPCTHFSTFSPINLFYFLHCTCAPQIVSLVIILSTFAFSTRTYAPRGQGLCHVHWCIPVPMNEPRKYLLNEWKNIHKGFLIVYILILSK